MLYRKFLGYGLRFAFRPFEIAGYRNRLGFEVGALSHQSLDGEFVLVQFLEKRDIFLDHPLTGYLAGRHFLKEFVVGALRLGVIRLECGEFSISLLQLNPRSLEFIFQSGHKRPVKCKISLGVG